MYKILYIIFFSLIVANCSFKPVVKHHGVPFLEDKQSKLIVNKSNKNDIRKILGNPSTTSKFDNDVWIYIERKQTQSKLKKISIFLSDFENKQELLNYFNDFDLNLSKKTLNSYLKSVSNP